MPAERALSAGVCEWRSEDAKEKTVAMAASIQALDGKRVFTGTLNVKLIMMISLSCALIE